MCLIIALACILPLSSPCEAQTFNNALRGVSQWQILVENVDSNSQSCGITKDKIRNAALYPRSSAKFEIVDDAASAISISVSTLAPSSTHLCFTVIRLTAQAVQSVRLDVSDMDATVLIILWEKSSILSTVRDEHSRHVTESIEDLAKKFVIDWNLDNKLASERKPELEQSASPFQKAVAAYNREDYAGALQLLRPVADSGNVRAQALLGFMYQGGLGVLKDYIEAAKWYRRAADTGDAIAQFEIGFMHLNGQGVPRDPVSAYMWLDLAAMREHRGAAT
jgi:hypothetical protein